MGKRSRREVGSVLSLFEAQVKLRPEAIAVEYGDDRLTYKVLNERTNQLARFLQRLGVGPKSIVGLLVERSPEMIIGLLGVLKAGGAYVPLDPSYPQERLAFMIEDAEVSLLLTQEGLAERAPGDGLHLVSLEGAESAFAEESGAPLSTVVTDSDLAYVIYTSGSTGRPKGVMVEHGSLMNLTQALGEAFALGPTDRVLQFASISWDTSVEEIYPALAHGATLVLREGRVPDGASAFWRRCETQALTVLTLPTAYWHMLVGALEEEALHVPDSVRLISIGGEAALPQRLKSWRECVSERVRLVNTYGSTEATAVSTMWDLWPAAGDELAAEPVPIGRPLAGVHAYIVDESVKPVSDGSKGELCIGGIGVARGYLKRPDLTAEKFVPDPFLGRTGARMFRTGDLARRRADGAIEYLGRRDEQVKIRGVRVEPGEIEAVLHEHPALRAAAVVAREMQTGNRYLAAYVVLRERDYLNLGTDGQRSPDGSGQPTIEKLREWLQEKVPAVMVPTAFVALDELPMTPNGKIDRRALPAPDMSELGRAQTYVAPRTPVEELLAEILAEVLKLERAGIEDNFFDLGGHSLLAMQVIARVRQAFGVELPLRSMFESPTVAELAEQIEKALRSEEVKKAPEIKRVARDGELALSFAQERIWLVDKMQPDSPVFHIPMAVRGKGSLDVEQLRQCFNELVARHEVLRTTFETVNGRPVQRIAAAMVLDLPVIDLSSLSEWEREARLQELLSKQAREPFDLARGPLLRTVLLWLTDEEYVVFVNMHHIISDDWSVNMFWQELSELYGAAIRGEAHSLPELPIQFADYAIWQRAYFQGEALEEQVLYWRERLSGVPALNLPTDYPRPVVQRYEGALVSLPLEDALFQGVRQLSRDENATPYITLLAAYCALLYRYTGQDDIAIGTAIANRRWLESESLMGALINMLVLRSSLSGDLPFRELLRRKREVALEAYVHQDLPFEKLVDELQPERSTSHSPLFQVGFNYINVPKIVVADGQEWEEVTVDRGSAQIDLTLTVKDYGQGAAIELEYSTALFSEETAWRMLEHYITLLEGAMNEPDCRLSELPVLTADEWEQVGQWNDSTTEFEHDLLLHELFEAQVEENPDTVAVVFGDEQLTYRELNQRANRLAHYLQALGVQSETLVGICVERSMEMIVGILGILKAGGAYVPLDPRYPQDRLAYMLADAQAPVLLTQADLLAQLPEHEARSTVCLDSDWERIAQESSEKPASGVTLGNLAYVIYTSGSTGKPKGVLVEHRGIGNLARVQEEALGLNETSRVLQFASFSFDGMVWELLALLAGATLVVAAQSDLMPGPPLVKLLRDQAITAATLPPSALAAMPSEQFPDLKTVVSAGEACSADIVTRWSRGRRFFNGYGPTESTVCATLAECEAGERTPLIGRPIANTQIYILDEYLNPVPIGVIGELCIGGIALARGYLNRPELTAERFIFHEGLNTRLYRTGDLGRYLPDGNIEYLGRLDHQVQVRGHRVELGEIEAVLTRHPGVRHSVVTVREDNPGDKRLVAYVVANDETASTLQDLRAAVREVLPDYMVPSAFVLLDELPLTPNKKVDLKALPTPAQTRPNLEEAFVAPGSSLEETLAAIWCEVLGIERVGVHDNFFDLGGHSLLVAQVHGKVQQALGLSDLPLVKLFQYATVSALAQYLSDQTDELPSRQAVKERAARQRAALARQKQLMRKANGNG